MAESRMRQIIHDGHFGSLTVGAEGFEIVEHQGEFALYSSVHLLCCSSLFVDKNRLTLSLSIALTHYLSSMLPHLFALI